MFTKDAFKVIMKTRELGRIFGEDTEEFISTLFLIDPSKIELLKKRVIK